MVGQGRRSNEGPAARHRGKPSERQHPRADLASGDKEVLEEIFLSRFAVGQVSEIESRGQVEAKGYPYARISSVHSLASLSRANIYRANVY